MTTLSHNVGQVVYPRMERQDLTQTQLGSFKFTPTDEVRPAFGISPRLAQQVQLSFGRDAPSGINIMPRGNAHSLRDATEHTHSSTRLGSMFFNPTSSTDFDRSHLHPGSSTLEAATDGACLSPRRRHFQTELHGSRQIPFEQLTESRVRCVRGMHASPPLTMTQMPEQSRDHVEVVPTQNSFLSFSPILSHRAPDDVDLIRTSLARALTCEQEAHRATKEALEVERSNRIKAQAEVERLMDHNRSLVGSVNMLKSVVQHSLKKEQEYLRSDIDRFYAEANAAAPAPTILHDAIKRLKVPRETDGADSIMEDALEEETRSQEPPAEIPSNKTAAVPAVNDKDLYDFDLVERFGTPALRRHFSSTIMTSDSGKPDGSQHSDHSADNQEEEATTRREKSDSTWESSETIVVADQEEEDENDDQPTPRVALKGDSGTMVMPFDPHVKWKTGQIFDDDQDKFSRLKYNANTPIFSRYPVRYIPRKSDKNLYRTIMMDFVPQGTTSKEILETIRGGAVESIQLCGPIGSSTDFVTARIAFVYELAARAVYMRGQHPGIHIQGKRVRVWQVLEPTYPRNAELEKDIFDENFSRLLLIANATQGALDKLPQKLEHQVRAGLVIEIGKAVDGIPMVEFSSIEASSNALNQLMNDPAFGGSRFDFETDPCAEPY